MTQLRSIAIVMSHGTSFTRGILAGICGYMQDKTDWVIVPFLSEARGLASARCRSCSGLIGYLYSPPLIAAVEKLKIPAVTIQGAHSESPRPRVVVDDDAVGRRAAEHFLERGFLQFAFVGLARPDYSDARRSGFVQRLRENGLSTEQFLYSGVRNRGREFTLLERVPGLEKWLANEPRPLAIFAANATIGFHISNACRKIGLRIPEDVALLDVDNDELLNQFCQPPNSSVALATHRMGFESARMLDRLMSGETLQNTTLAIPPIGVVVRQSTDTMATDDLDIIKAVRFIRRSERAAVSVGDVVEHVALSRSTLDRKFQKLVGHTLAEEIRRTRRERAKTLLAGTDLSIAYVAEKSGYSGNVELSVDFKNHLHVTPSQYRQQFQLLGLSAYGSHS